MMVPQPLLAGILGLKLPSFPTKGQLDYWITMIIFDLVGWNMLKIDTGHPVSTSAIIPIDPSISIHSLYLWLPGAVLDIKVDRILEMFPFGKKHLQKAGWWLLLQFAMGWGIEECRMCTAAVECHSPEYCHGYIAKTKQARGMGQMRCFQCTQVCLRLFLCGYCVHAVWNPALASSVMEQHLFWSHRMHALV